MDIKTRVLLGIGLSGVACLVLFALMGSTVDEAGVLREPFFLLPLGNVLMLAGFGGALGRLGWLRLRRKRGRHG